MTRTRKWLAGTTAVIAVLATLCMGGCAYFKDWQQLPVSKIDERTIYVVSHGWHADIVIARNELGDALQFVPAQLGESPYYEFGWGDKAFYQAESATIGIIIKAAFWPTPSTMHVVALPEAPAIHFPESETAELHVSAAGLRALVAAIADSFTKDANGESKSTGVGLYGHSLFFDGNGNYYLTNTCNTWTARMLARAGVPTTETLTITTGSLMRQIKWAAEKYHRCNG
jgi:uncharacterized protein (TIGR02117 family)